MPTHRQIVSDHYQASARGDLAGMLAPLAPDTAWTEAAGFPCAGTYIGPEAVAENVFGALARQWQGYSFELERLLDDGDWVVAVGTYRGTHRVSGKSFTARVVHLWHLENGVVKTFEQVVDSVPVVEAAS